MTGQRTQYNNCFVDVAHVLFLSGPRMVYLVLLPYRTNTQGKRHYPSQCASCPYTNSNCGARFRGLWLSERHAGLNCEEDHCAIYNGRDVSLPGGMIMEKTKKSLFRIHNQGGQIRCAGLCSSRTNHHRVSRPICLNEVSLPCTSFFDVE